ncbi:MAG: Fic family protein [Chloroflexi bacterium]|nr:Fic family protein [Chloroflexota bacterium]
MSGTTRGQVPPGETPSPPGPRKYVATHRWITFRADLSHVGIELWLLLGEAMSKIAHIAGVPLLPETADRLHHLYLAKGALATTAIEGNTLTEEQVLQHLEGKLKLPASQQYLTKEIDNILAASNTIAQDVIRGADGSLSADRIRAFNRLVLDGLQLDDDVVPGEFRQHSVVVANYRGVPAEDCEFLVSEMSKWLNHPSLGGGTKTMPPIGYAILRAVLAHLYLAWIHPFGDGNGRTARLLELQILLAAGVPMPAAHLLSNHYNHTRSEYYRVLARTSSSGGDVIPFVLYAVRGFVDGLRAQLDVIREQQWEVAWENYVHRAFKDNKGPTAERRRWLALDLTKSGGPVPRSAIRDLTPRLARAYASKTEKTLTRDLNALHRMRLVLREKDGYRANRTLIIAFLPAKVREG